ncbi:hypothetical protein KEM56_006942, partial [Ascosphaera pollenicola]
MVEAQPSETQCQTAEEPDQHANLNLDSSSAASSGCNAAGLAQAGEDKREDGKKEDESQGFLISPEQWSTYLDNILDFLASADTNTLAVVFAVAFVLTYTVFGRLGLILIGVVAGVVLQGFWEGGNQEDQSIAARHRRELNAELAARVLRWHDEDRLVEMTQENSIRSAGERLDYTDFHPAVSAALASFTEAAVRELVESWYNGLLPSDNSFPIACRVTLTRFLRSLSLHLARRKPTDIFIQFLTNTSSIAIVFLSEIAGALQSASLSGSVASTNDAIQHYLTKYPESSLAGILSRAQQYRKIKSVSADFLETFLRPEEHDCDLLRTFLREVLGGLVIENVIEECSKPELINSWLIYLLEAGETDLMQAIDEGVGGVTQGEDQKALDSKVSTPRDSIDSNGQRSRASNEMDEAISEAKRLSAMIAAQDALRTQQNEEEDVNRASEDTTKDDGTTHESWETVSGLPSRTSSTPTSSSSGWEKMSPPDTHPPPSSEPQIPESDTLPPAGKISVTEVSSVPAELAAQANPLSTIPLNAQLPTPVIKDINPGPISFHNATISLMDDSTPREKSKLRSKPSHEYLLQIEPKSTRHSGWVITRKYADFENLHEGLKRISGISGAAQFTIDHANLPPWKAQTKSALRDQLEQYLQDALHYGTLADSERMKKFLQKETEPVPAKTSPKNPFSIIKPSNTNMFENMGKGMLEALSNTPKDISKGGRAMFEGMSNVFGPRHSLDVGRDDSGSSAGSPRNSADVRSFFTPKRAETANALHNADLGSSPSQRVIHSRTWSEDPARTSSSLPTRSDDGKPFPRSRLSLQLPRNPRDPSHDALPPALGNAAPLGDVAEDEPEISLTYDRDPLATTSTAIPQQGGANDDQSRRSSDGSTKSDHHMKQPVPPPQAGKPSNSPSRISEDKRVQEKKELDPDTILSSEELDVSVELLFAIINETYSLSSAWAIRKKLLNAAKSFFLKPGNPGLESIRTYLEDSIIRSNSSDEALAAHIENLRQSALPTPQELASKPPARTEDEKEDLRARARKIFVTRGMPKALMGVM